MNPASLLALAALAWTAEIAPVPVVVGPVPVAPVAGAAWTAPVPSPAAFPLALPVALPAAAPRSPTLLQRLGALFGGANRSPHALAVEHLAAFESLQQVHGKLAAGERQAALDDLDRLFTGKRARDWYAGNPDYAHYRAQGFAYYRHAERLVMADYEAGVARAVDPALLYSAKAAPVFGHSYRETELQEKDAPWCAYHALLNAIRASSGFGEPFDVRALVGFAKRLLDRNVVPTHDDFSLGQVEAAMGVRLRVRASHGLSDDNVDDVARALGGAARADGFPSTEAELLDSFARGEERLLGFRFFHARFPLPESVRQEHGHDYEVLGHEGYLLGAFPHAGRWYYMVQDSGVGRTTFYTFAELRSIVKRSELVRFPGPVSLPP
ncbi:MAG: hypothetical protein HY925_12965 [Elusimicrobia bacterium]|nr:hypothetical protein [Elusimicrobiota bacterium]